MCTAFIYLMFRKELYHIKAAMGFAAILDAALVLAWVF